MGTSFQMQFNHKLSRLICKLLDVFCRWQFAIKWICEFKFVSVDQILLKKSDAKQRRHHDIFDRSGHQQTEFVPKSSPFFERMEFEIAKSKI